MAVDSGVDEQGAGGILPIDAVRANEVLMTVMTDKEVSPNFAVLCAKAALQTSQLDTARPQPPNHEMHWYASCSMLQTTRMDSVTLFVLTLPLSHRQVGQQNLPSIGSFKMLDVISTTWCYLSVRF